MAECLPSEVVTREELERLRRSGRPLARELHELLLTAVATGRFARGTRMPSIRAMARHCGCSPDTVVHAYRQLVADGSFEAVRGSGFYVSGRTAKGAGVSHQPEVNGSFSLLAERPLLDLDLPAERQPGSGLIHPSLVSGEQVARILRSALRTRPDLLCGAGEPEGYRPLRQQIARKLTEEGIACTPDAIITGAGATGVMSLVVRTFLRPGMVALMEEPGPFLHRNLLLSQGAIIASVPRLPDGPDMAALRRLCAEHRPRIFFCASAHHNPTGGDIAPRKAHELLQIAAEFDLLLVDDVSYADLRDPAERGFWTPLAMLDDFSRVIQVGSFSRLLGPALGVGYLAAMQTGSLP